MKQVNIHNAKTHLSKLIEDVESGEEVIIARAGKPVARLSGVGKSSGIAVGVLAGRFTIPDDFASPLPADLLDALGSIEIIHEADMTPGVQTIESVESAEDEEIQEEGE